MILTIDIEENTHEISSSYLHAVFDPLLQVLERKDSHSTFFFVGNIATLCREFIKEVSALGHEIGLHGYTHRPLSSFTKAQLNEEVKKGKGQLEEICQTDVRGFRAPYFSMTEECVWATELLFENGYRYSSSVLPGWNIQPSFPRAIRGDFVWKSGLVEFPVPTYGFGKLRLPIVGGAYLRLAPKAILNHAVKRAEKSPTSFTYCHPYDFGLESVQSSLSDTKWMTKVLQYRTDLMFERISQQVSQNTQPLCKWAEDSVYIGSLKTFEPEHTEE